MIFAISPAPSPRRVPLLNVRRFSVLPVLIREILLCSASASEKVTQPNGNPGCKDLYVCRIRKEEAKGLTYRNKNLQFTYILAIGVVLQLATQGCREQSPNNALARSGDSHYHQITLWFVICARLLWFFVDFHFLYSMTFCGKHPMSHLTA
jgi:hypothetical protein